MSRDIRIVADEMSYLEGPRWHDGRVWFSDFYTYGVYSASPDGGDVRLELTVDQQPSGLGWLPDGRLLIVSMKDRKLLRREADGSVVTHADLTDLAGGHVNDMVVAADGTAYLGEFGFDLMGGADFRPSNLLCVDPDGNASIAARGLFFANGLMITDDGGTLLVNETFGNRISAFDLLPDGGVGERRDWATFGPVPTETAQEALLAQVVVGPDGGTLDAEGCVWIADAIGGRAVRVREGGEIVDEVKPDGGVFACALGGESGSTLFLCVAPDFNESARSAAREASLQAAEVDVPRAGRP